MYISQSYVYISIFGENFSPIEFTKLIGLNPSDIGVKGEKRKTGAILKECFWKYQLNDTNALEGLEESLKRLAFLFSDKIDAINNFVQENNLKIKCFVVIKSKNNEDSGVVLENSFISFLNELRAVIEINIYYS